MIRDDDSCGGSTQASICASGYEITTLEECEAAALDLIQALCQWQPGKRPTAAEALRHPFFEVPHLPNQHL